MYLFLLDALHVSDRFSVHHRELKTAHTASQSAEWVTLSSARCKYKMISAQQAELNNYKKAKLKLLKTNAAI